MEPVSLPLAVRAVHIYLDVGQQLRGILKYIDQHWRRIALHEQGRVLLCEIAHIRIIQGHILPVRPHQLLQQRGLPNLPGAKRKSLEPQRVQGFLHGGDYWTRTSGLMRVKHAL